MNTRRDFLKASLVGIPALGLSGAVASQVPQKRPNIIYFVCHDLGRYISPYGAQVDTPHLAAFARSGMVLENAFCSSPACSPSRGCAMTGLHAHKTGLEGVNHMGTPVGKMWELRPDQKTIVNYLNEAGYLTANAGFQHERHTGFTPEELAAQGDPNGYQVHVGPRTWPSCFVENTVDLVIDWLRQRDPNDSQPFYLNVGTQEAHATVWEGDLGKMHGRPEVYGVDDPATTWIPPSFPDNIESHKILSKFWPCVRHLDKEFGRLVRAIDEQGYGENTIVVFTTDHGITGSRHKGRLFDDGTEISAIIRFNGKIPAGSRSGALIGNVDFCPTFLEAADVPISAGVDGRSFWPLLTGGNYTPHESIVIERNYHLNYDPMRAVRAKDFLYIRNFHPKARYFYTPPEILALPEPMCNFWPNNALISATDFDDSALKDRALRPREQLYDLRNDPMQRDNVSDHPEYASVLSGMRQELEQWMKENDDRLLYGEVEYGTGTLQ